MLNPMLMVWDTVVNIARTEYECDELQAEIYAMGCCFRAAWENYERMMH